MKRLVAILSLCLLASTVFGQGTSCAAPIDLSLDGVIHDYPTSSATGTALVCTSYTGTTPITWFRFTTTATAECPLLEITAANGGSIEIGFYTACGTLVTASSMCFNSGTGLWAPSETFVLTPNTSYYLRIKTSAATTLSIGGQFHTPLNDDCPGAFTITSTPLSDNNACHKPGPVVTAVQLCASTLENTAFYKFQVATTGSAIINISSIECNNISNNSSNGFQIGFFTGTCAALNSIDCTNGSGTFVQATTPSLPAGTLVYVAIDGLGGSNCKYKISGVNVYGVLAGEEFKNFSGWKKNGRTVLRWKAGLDSGSVYFVEKSADGVRFDGIGTVNAHATRSDYDFTDASPGALSFYRIRRVSSQGGISVSRVIQVRQEVSEALSLAVAMNGHSSLQLHVKGSESQVLDYVITSSGGYTAGKGRLVAVNNQAALTKDLSFLPAGQYFLTVFDGNRLVSTSFTKL